MKKEKPDCYKCIHKGSVAGSAHSQCLHPATKAIHDNSRLKLFALLGRGQIPQIQADGIQIKGAEQGIRGGWFNWHLNFDPTWLEECSGLQAKEDDK